MNIRGKRVLVMGLGIHGGGLGVTKWLLRQGATVTVTDLKNAEALAPSLQALKDLPVRYVLGEHRAEDIVSTDLIVRSPGVPRESEWLKLARDRGIPIEMEMGLFFAELPRASKQVIGITGTKGKTTTTLMVGAILGNANPKTIIAGNLRISAMELLERIDAETTVILELSSWQLEGLEPLRQSPHIAAITNVSPDHLNRYRDFDDYAESKALIFRYQQPDDFLVLNFDAPILTRFAPQAFSQVVWTSAKQLLQQGAYLEGHTLIWRWDGHKQSIIDLDRRA